jgi:hypothetical protein
MIDCTYRTPARAGRPVTAKETDPMNADLRRRADDLTARLTALRDSL